MLNIIKNLLLDIVNKIDTGNCNISTDDQMKVIEMLQQYTDKTQLLSKTQACDYLNVSRATFDNLVKAGKIPKGQKRRGFNELSWIQKDLDAAKRKKN